MANDAANARIINPAQLCVASMHASSFECTSKAVSSENSFLNGSIADAPGGQEDDSIVSEE